MLNREQILAIKDYQIEPVEVPEWNTTVYVRTMTGDCRDKFEAKAAEAAASLALKGQIDVKAGEEVDMSKVLDFSGMIGVRARLVAWTACDEKGKLLFTDDDIKALGKKNGVAMDRLFEVAQRVNHMTDKELDTLEKKLESAQS